MQINQRVKKTILHFRRVRQSETIEVRRSRGGVAHTD